MDTHATLRSRDRGTPQGRGWRFIVPAIALLILAHQVLLATPLHASIIPGAPASEQTIPGSSCVITCLPTVARVCEAGQVCATVQAVFNRLPFMPLMILALLVLATLAPRVHFSPVSPYGALWPPQRRRALLQIFLI